MSTRAFTSCVALVVCGAAAAVVHAQSPEALKSWRDYTAATDARVARELAAGEPFLAMDFTKTGPADHRAVLAGQIVIRDIDAFDAQGKSIEVSGGLIHHWRGAAFVPSVTIDRLLAQLQDVPPETYQEDVVTSKILARGPDTLNTYLKLRRKKFVTAIYNTEHEVIYRHHGPKRASSVSHATKIAELEDPLTPKERERPPGKDRGFLWRWQAYWRYEQVDRGVIMECESVSLSRTVPWIFRLIVGPIITSTARDSMERTLIAIRDRLPKSEP